MAGKERIVAMGPREEIIGLRSIGIELVPVATARELQDNLPAQAARTEVQLVLVSETVADGARELVAETRDKTGAIIMLVPSHRGSKGTTIQWMKEAMAQSIGVDVISD